ncbi:hypothetical protein OHB54_07365 [Streptomyces sp. NBC_01007]|nr:hypothetical protein OHB54_07365 [Streptomyces sp. NBC_01007]
MRTPLSPHQKCRVITSHTTSWTFSEHADADQVIDWLRGAPAQRTTYLVHGEPDAPAALRGRVDRQLSWTAGVPSSGEHVLVR